MKIAVRYYTKTGNTKKLADAVANALSVPAEDVASPLDEAVDLLFLCSSVYAAGVDASIKTFIAENKDRIGKIVNISTAALLTSTYKQVKKIADQCGVAVADEEFHCRGAFAVLHKGRPNDEDLQAAAAFAKRIAGQICPPDDFPTD